MCTNWNNAWKLWDDVLPTDLLVSGRIFLPIVTMDTTVSQVLVLASGNPPSTLTTHCGMDKTVVDLSVPAVITQTSHGSARSFLRQLQMTWSSVSVGINLQ